MADHEVKTVSVTIKEGKHAPSFWQRLRNMRVWFRKLPYEFEVYDVSIEYSKLLIEIKDQEFSKGAAHLTDLFHQVNKLGGVAYGMPTYSKKYNRRIHANSGRMGWRMAYPFKLVGYRYVRGERMDNCKITPDNWFTESHISMGLRLGRRNFRFAYFLGPYFGGDIPAPCDIKISYKIRFIR